MLNRLRQMLRKEFIQLFRDPHARFSLLVPTILQVLIYGYAATFELHHIRMAVLDLDHSYESRDLLSRFESNGHFELTATLSNRHQITDLIDRGKVDPCDSNPAGVFRALTQGSDCAGADYPRRQRFEHGAYRPGLHK